ncbi:MAG TPA: TrbI/VirB10 family protein [Rhizomicrobium sp.]
MTAEPHTPTERPEEPKPEIESHAPPPKEILSHPHEMRLRTERPGVTRLSRRVLVGTSVVTCGGICIALAFALWPHRQTSAPRAVSTGTNILPEDMANLPNDYAAIAKVPKLGPPLPGDLGKPMLKAGVTAPGMPSPPTPEQQRVAQEQDAARTSHLFATSNVSQPVASLPTAPAPSAAQAATSPGGSTDQNPKLAFLNGTADHQPESPDRLRAAPSPYVLQAGAVIPAALITGLRSDLPGQVTAQVTEDVFDSATGKILLIPQGAHLIGQYDAQITFGQSRALLVWNRLILPNGRSIVLERQPGIDTEGYAGLEDQVDEHWGSLFEAATLSTLLSVGAEAGTSNSENNLAQAIRQGASQSFNQVGQQVVGRSLNVQPTITIRPGFPVRVLVTHDLVLEPYHG